MSKYMVRVLTLFLTLFSSVALSSEPHFHELIESRLTADLGNPFGKVSAEVVLDTPNGKIEHVTIRSNYGEAILDSSQFIGVDIVRLSQLSIVSFALDLEGFEPSFSICVPFGKGKFSEKGGRKRLLMPVLGVRTTAEGSHVFTLPLPENGVRREDHDGCFYLSER